MKVTRTISKIGLWFLLPLACIVVAGTGRQNRGASIPRPEDQFTPLIRSLKGPDLFRAYCASCHGIDGKGGGPAAVALKAKVPDLTVLAMNNRGEFPAVRVRQMITGEAIVAAHGSREMPIWGPIFHQVEEDIDRGHVRLQNLVDYLQSIQSVPPLKSVSGAALYKQNCAACHGNDLKGNRSAPPPFGDVPDLTALAQRHGGVFPDAYVTNVLRNGVQIRAHGTAEMPIWEADFRISNGLNGAQVTERIGDLTSYIKSQQAK